MQAKLKKGDQVKVENNKELIVGVVVDQIEERRYLIDYKQGRMVVHDSQDLILYTPRQTRAQKISKEALSSHQKQSFRRRSPKANLIFQEDKLISHVEHKPTKKSSSKLKKIEEKKQRKQMQKIVAKLENKPYIINHQPQLTICGELRMLIDKFNQFVVGSWSNKLYTEQITPEEVQRLAQLLSQQTKLDMNQLLNQWLIERFILILKDMKQFRLQKYKHIQKIIDCRYKQILREIHSQQFHNIEMREQRRKYILAKTKANKLDIY